MTDLAIKSEAWPIAGAFTIARGSRTEAKVVTVTVKRDGIVGRGECVPYPRYGESIESVTTEIENVRAEIEGGLTRQALQLRMPAGAARNAVDCALFDLEAKSKNITAFEMAGLTSMKPVTTAYTISLGTPEVMAERARDAAHRPLLKVKLGSDGDTDRIEAVRAAAPDSQLIVDANEGWTDTLLEENMAACHRAGVTLVEQPLPAGNDDALRDIARPVPICADESSHTADTIDDLVGKYDAINIKLDKTGGITGALALLKAAQDRDFKIMMGCMVGTSLAMAPAMIIAQSADVVDLDGPLLLAEDRVPGLKFDGSVINPPSPELWG
ncbi:MAG: N-acetyl-D-Glu racemase DgcA [Pseudomonadota bacterium]